MWFTRLCLLALLVGAVIAKRGGGGKKGRGGKGRYNPEQFVALLCKIDDGGATPAYEKACPQGFPCEEKVFKENKQPSCGTESPVPVKLSFCRLPFVRGKACKYVNSNGDVTNLVSADSKCECDESTGYSVKVDGVTEELTVYYCKKPDDDDEEVTGDTPTTGDEPEAVAPLTEPFSSGGDKADGETTERVNPFDSLKDLPGLRNLFDPTTCSFPERKPRKDGRRTGDQAEGDTGRKGGRKAKAPKRQKKGSGDKKRGRSRKSS